jgi:ABC-type sugar transport system ATPase subunit
MSILDNLVAADLGRHASAGLLSWRKLRALAQRVAGDVGIDRARLGGKAAQLSGGNQQKLLFGRALARARPGTLLMNEPTRGIDVGARADIYRLMRGMCARGWTLIMTSSDLEEVVGMADVVYTMFRGRIVGRYERADISQAAILSDIIHPHMARDAA